MIYYKLYQGKNQQIGTAGKWYARPVVTETVDLDMLAEHMANHNTPYSKGVIKGVLEDMIVCIKELLLEGKQVKIPDLAIFGVGLSSEGAATAKDFSVVSNIRRVYLRTRSTGTLNNRTVKAEVVLKEYSKYDVTK